MATSMLYKYIRFYPQNVFQGARKLQERQKNLMSSTGQSHESEKETGATNQSSRNSNPDIIKKKILEASLPYVSVHGWTKTTISAGAESIGYPGVSHGLFPRGGAELVQYFYMSCNNNLAERLKQEVKEAQEDPSKRKKPPRFVRDAVENRLRMIIPYLKQWPQAIAIMSMPQNVPTSLANLLTLVDDICYYAGDKSVDFSWYTRRIVLAGVYKATELSLIQDSSEEYEATWRFLDRRIEDVVQLQNYLNRSGEVSSVAQETATAVFSTARNILGLSR